MITVTFHSHKAKQAFIKNNSIKKREIESESLNEIVIPAYFEQDIDMVRDDVSSVA